MNNVPTRILRARWVAPISSPVIENGAILLHDGTIRAVGKFPEMPAGEVHDLGDNVLLPGLINAHAHLELSDCQPGEKPAGGLEEWLARMLSRTRLELAELERKSQAAARSGAEQCLRFGVTMVGDISRLCHVTRPVLREMPLRVVSFGEVAGMAKRRALLEKGIEAASDRSCQTQRLRIGISPHAPYSVEVDGYRRCVQVAREQGTPLATHLAETRSEWDFLRDHSGPLRLLWERWLGWDEQVPRFPGGPIALARETGLLDLEAVLAHVNYNSDEELNWLARGRASVVYCPRTHEFFGHPEHRFREMLSRGINVAVGTDSCASSPDLNLVDDLRLLHRKYPEMPVETLWRMATVNGAIALSCANSAGTLAHGKVADIVAFPAEGKDPLRSVLETAVIPSGVWVSGERFCWNPEIV